MQDEQGILQLGPAKLLTQLSQLVPWKFVLQAQEPLPAKRSEQFPLTQVQGEQSDPQNPGAHNSVNPAIKTNSEPEVPVVRLEGPVVTHIVPMVSATVINPSVGT